MNMNMCTCLTGRWNADVILRLQQLLQLQAWSNVCRCSAKSLKEKTTLFCHSRIGSSPRSSRPFISTFSLNPKPLKRFCKCIFGTPQPRKRNSFLFPPPRHAEVRPCWHWPTLSSSLPWGPTSFSDLYLLRARLTAEQLWHHKSLWKKNFERL